ncbi:hypothetical protein AB0J82_34775 [Asanoa sp. NPDC049518]|uniref:hypothetical protein n=1 Tax=unclassified Asanoa TaxID=2685164 RepID=UPI003436F802
MEELDVIQRVGGNTSDVGPAAGEAKRSDTILIELAIDPCQVPKACGGERLHLLVVVFK